MSHSTTSTPSTPACERREARGEVERYEDSHRLCSVRGPEGIVVELAQRIG